MSVRFRFAMVVSHDVLDGPFRWVFASGLVRAPFTVGGMPASPWSLAPSNLASRFFEAYPDYPLTRMSRDPGEGVWFPRDDLVHDGWRSAKQDADVVLNIRGEVKESIPESRSERTALA